MNSEHWFESQLIFCYFHAKQNIFPWALAARREVKGQSSSFYFYCICTVSPTSLSCRLDMSHFRSICFGLSHNKNLRDSLPFGQMDWRCNILLLVQSGSFSRHIHASIIRSALYLPHLHLTVLNFLIGATAPSHQSSSFFLPPSYTVSMLPLKLFPQVCYRSWLISDTLD